MDRIGPRRVVIFTFDGVQSLDVTGPYEVFAAAGAGAYSIELVAPGAGSVRAGSGLDLVATVALADITGPIDTFLVAGGDAPGVRAVAGDARLLAEVRRVAARSERVASVCSGAFVLAAAGLLDGRRATTHWTACEELARRYPQISVDPDPIFVRDGAVATSAGVTAGIDLALAFVEEDCGHATAMAVARRLVVFLKRPGGQAQFSATLATQADDHDDLGELQVWIAEHLDEDLAVSRLADRVAMSPRHFARIFRAATGTTPARFVALARIEAARRRLEESEVGVEAIAHECGFGTAETMRRAFLRTLRVSPTDYRGRFPGANSTRSEAS